MYCQVLCIISHVHVLFMSVRLPLHIYSHFIIICYPLYLAHSFVVYVVSSVLNSGMYSVSLMCMWCYVQTAIRLMNITDSYIWYKELTPPTKGVLEIIIMWSAHGVRRDLEYPHQCITLQAGPRAASWYGIACKLNHWSSFLAVPMICKFESLRNAHIS